MTDTMAQRVWSINEVADWLHVHRKTVEKLIAAGDLGHMAVGRRKFVRDDQLTAFIDAHTIDGH